MNQFTRIMFVVMNVFLLTLASACGNVEATNDSQHVIAIASKIADFDLPAGYTPEFSAQMSGYLVASYRGENGPSHLYLIQSENQADSEALERVLNQLAPGSSDPSTRMTVIENCQATVRGQEVNVVISEGENSENVPYRQVTVGFQGKGGPALLVFSQSVELWNQEAVDTFLQSIQ